MKLIILTVNGFFGQALYPWESLNLKRISDYFEQRNWEVDIVDMHEIANKNKTLEKELIFYTSSQIPEVKLFIDDIVTLLARKNTLVPDYDLFRSHDNKGFQELLKIQRGIKSIPAKYYSSVEVMNSHELIYPTVIKKAGGASGLGVWLVKNPSKLNKRLKNFRKETNTKKELLLKLKGVINSKVRRINDWGVTCSWFKYLDHQKGERVIVQDFINNLSFDYKVLIFFDRYYVLKRFINKNDFRASGSGKFQHVTELQPELLSYAKEVFRKLESPFASLDICSKNRDFYLIEFQVPHMGPLTLIEAEGFFFEEKQNWHFKRTKSFLEDSYAYSLLNFLTKRHE